MLQKIADKILKITGGRSTAFFIAFFVSGNAMAWLGRLDHTYVEFMVGLGGLVVAHSAKEDYFEQKAPDAPPAGGSDDRKV